MKRYVDIERIGKQFGTCLWVASYKTTGLQLAPDFAYFPSMNYVAMWQFAENWHGTDGNVELVSVIKGDVKNAVAVKPTVTVSGECALLFGLAIRGGASRLSVDCLCMR